MPILFLEESICRFVRSMNAAQLTNLDFMTKAVKHILMMIALFLHIIDYEIWVHDVKMRCQPLFRNIFKSTMHHISQFLDLMSG